MTLFSYTAVNDRKERIQGMVDAISLQAGRSALQETGLFVEEIHEATPSERESAKPWETEAVVEALPSPRPLPPATSYSLLLHTPRPYAGWLPAWCILVIG